MKKVVIIRCGFAGITALRKIGKMRGLEMVLIDRKTSFDFLPLLPDILSNRVHVDCLTLA